MNIRKVRRAMARGKSIRVAVVPVEHRKGTASAKAATVFGKMWKPYIKGDVKRQELLKRATKAAKISPATASTYLHQFAQHQGQ